MDRFFADTIVEREASGSAEATRIHSRSWDRAREQHVFEAPTFIEATQVDATRLDASEASESAWAAWIGREPEHARLEGAFAVTKLTPLPSLFAEAPPAPSKPAPLARRVLGKLSARARACIAMGLAAIAIAAWALWPAAAPLVIKSAADKEMALVPDGAAAEPLADVASLAEAPPLADAASLVITGRVDDAALAYAAIAREHPERPELATMARLLASGGALETPEHEGAP